MELSKGKRSEVTIVTLDQITDLSVDDRIEYGGEFLELKKIVADDLNKNKRFMTPTFETQITLVK